MILFLEVLVTTYLLMQFPLEKDLVTYHIVVAVPYYSRGKTRNIEYLTDRFELKEEVFKETVERQGWKRSRYLRNKRNESR